MTTPNFWHNKAVDALDPRDTKRWRKILASAHPDAGGNHEDFVFLQAVRDEVLKDPQVVERIVYVQATPMHFGATTSASSVRFW